MDNIKKKNEYKNIKIGNNRVIRLNFSLSFSLYVELERLASQNKVGLDLFKSLVNESDVIVEFPDNLRFYLSEADLHQIAKELLIAKDVPIIDENSVIDQYIEIIENERKIRTDELIKALKPLIDRIHESQKPIIQALSNLAESLRTNPIFQEMSRLSEVANSSMIAGINVFLTNYKSVLSSIEEATLIATKYDWFLSHKALQDDQLFNEILELGHQEVSQSVFDSMFIKYFPEKRVLEIIDQIAEHKNGRKFKNILNEIKIGYEQHLYYLVVPTTLSILEGMVATYEEHYGRMKQEDYVGYLNDIFDKKRFIGIKDLVLIRVLAPFKHGQAIESPLSRHAILHGADQKYGTQVNCIRCVLILNEIIYALDIKEM